MRTRLTAARLTASRFTSAPLRAPHQVGLRAAMVGTFDALVARGHAQPGELYCLRARAHIAHALVGFVWHGDMRSARRPRAPVEGHGARWRACRPRRLHLYIHFYWHLYKSFFMCILYILYNIKAEYLLYWY